MVNPKPCLKNCYDTRKEAKKRMKELNKAHHFEGKLNNIYYCEQCSSYHLTSMPKQKSRDWTRHLNKLK